MYLPFLIFFEKVKPFVCQVINHGGTMSKDGVRILSFNGKKPRHKRSASHLLKSYEFKVKTRQVVGVYSNLASIEGFSPLDWPFEQEHNSKYS